MTNEVVFNHPVSALYWVVRRKNAITPASGTYGNNWFDFSRTASTAQANLTLGDDTITEASILLNGAAREGPRDALYYRTLQPAKYWNRTPRKNIYAYSFAMSPSSWYPTGSINLSRIDKTQLKVDFPANDGNGNPFPEATMIVMAENFNVLRLQGGMAKGGEDINIFVTLFMLVFYIRNGLVELAKALLHVACSGKPLRALTTIGV